MFEIFKRKYKEEDWFKGKTYKSNIKIKYPFEINKDDINLIIKGIALGDIAGSIYEGLYTILRMNRVKFILSTRE